MVHFASVRPRWHALCAGGWLSRLHFLALLGHAQLIILGGIPILAIVGLFNPSYYLDQREDMVAARYVAFFGSLFIWFANLWDVVEVFFAYTRARNRSGPLTHRGLELASVLLYMAGSSLLVVAAIFLNAQWFAPTGMALGGTRKQYLGPMWTLTTAAWTLCAMTACYAAAGILQLVQAFFASSWLIAGLFCIGTGIQIAGYTVCFSINVVIAVNPIPFFDPLFDNSAKYVHYAGDKVLRTCIMTILGGVIGLVVGTGINFLVQVICYFQHSRERKAIVSGHPLESTARKDIAGASGFAFDYSDSLHLTGPAIASSLTAAPLSAMPM
eukprot:TRINITY_DN35_c0_g1_i1.p1 TRINITY_DN35_c0_g1~~TRINITY_DN35_c0_g1_i1.p1  ORF type:complete len:349 (-),score=40.37 TRINITY_DN35_c0_g1_i1:622-1602(-)